MMTTEAPQFTSADIHEFYKLLDELGIEVWLDGGWAVDALLGEQTRPHDDVDIIVEQKDVNALRTALEARGYREVIRDDTRPINFVLSDTGREAGRIVDFHVVVLDADGNGDYGEEKAAFPAWGLTGTGTIDGLNVRTLSPALLVQFHQGYTLRDKDFSDIPRLCEKFNIPLPDAYRDAK